jgi:epoxide hydrolase-like predicted phosphatase
MVKAILFDLGDTILHSDWKPRDEAMIKEAGISVLLTPETKPLYLEISAGKKSVKELFKKILEQSNSDKTVEEVIEIYKRNYQKFSSIDEKMLKIVKKLRKRYKVYAFSNTNTLHEEINKKRGLYEHFDDIFLSCDLGVIKPNKEVFHIVLGKVGLKANETLFIDDNEKNINVAKEVGMEAIQFKDYNQLILEFKNRSIL